MEGGLGTPNRRTFLAGALGTAGLVVAGCNKPPVSGITPSASQSATGSAQATASPTQPGTSATSVRPRSHRPTEGRTASASMIIKRLAKHQP